MRASAPSYAVFVVGDGEHGSEALVFSLGQPGRSVHVHGSPRYGTFVEARRERDRLIPLWLVLLTPTNLLAV